MATLLHMDSNASFDGRLEDYLDDKLQTIADFESLDTLLSNVELQCNQLQAQLDNALKELDEARRSADDRQASIATRIDEFRQLQASIDTRVQVAAESDAPNKAIARLQSPMNKLRTIELTTSYLQFLQDVARWKDEAKSHLPASPKAALAPYTTLKQLSVRLKGLEGGDSLHLVDHVDKVTESLWQEMKLIMSSELEDMLKKKGWPRVDPQSEMDDEWLSCIERLIDLQMPEIEVSDHIVPLLPFEVMSKIFVQEFRFHFWSDKPTSSPQSLATHCYPWFLTTVEKWEDFFRDNLGHLLASKFDGSAVEDSTVYADPVCALITAMLPAMREKVSSVAQEALSNPPFLSTFISKLLSFDDTIRSRFNYDGGDPQLGWPGLAGLVLDEHFDTWFQAERKLALDRFDIIMDSQEGRKIDYDFAETGRMKPTLAAVQVTDLLRSVTGQYDRLRRFRHKIRFLTNIQLDILDKYHERLRGSLEAYQSITSTLGRTLHGVSREQLAALEGTGALETLCKVIGSADHVANVLVDWSDEEFFADMWDELQSHDNKRSSTDSVALNLSYSDILDRTSSNANGDDQGALFDETVNAFTSRRKAGESLLVAALAESHYKAFKAYTTQVQWTTVGEASSLGDLSLTAELDEPLHILRRNLDFLFKAVSTACLRRVWHEALDKLQDLLWNNVLLRQNFTGLGAAQFRHDGAAIFSLIDRYIPNGSTSLMSLREGMVLLSLPSTAPAGGSSPDDGQLADVTLKTVSDRAFKDNDEARKVLDELGLQELTPTNARYILQRRVENNDDVGW